MTWPSVDAPATAPADHGEVRTQAYYAGGGDYYRTGRYAFGIFGDATLTTISMAADTLRFKPFLVPVRRSFDRIGVSVSTAATAGGVLRLGIYGVSDGWPGTLLLDAGTVSSTTTGAKEVTISISLDPGLYWLAAVAQVASCTIHRHANDLLLPALPATTTAPTTAGFHLPYKSGVSGALPSPAAASSTGEVAPALALRAA